MSTGTSLILETKTWWRELWRRLKAVGLVFIMIVLPTALVLTTNLPRSAVLWASFVVTIGATLCFLYWKEQVSKLYGEHESALSPEHTTAEVIWERVPGMKTVVGLDPMGYSDIARELEEHFSGELIATLNDQIQSFVDAGLRAVNLPREQAVMATTGDGTILVFDHAEYAHHFAEAVHEATQEYNATRTIASAKRWFRIGIATGDITVEHTADGGRQITGLPIINAVRLEAVARIGEVLIDVATFTALPAELQTKYGGEEKVTGKRHETFHVRRCVMISGGAAWPTSLLALPRNEAMAQIETLFDREYLPPLLEEARGNVTQAARKAGLDPTTFRTKWEAAGLPSLRRQKSEVEERTSNPE
jgi:class 3 adenylate cyclase